MLEKYFKNIAESFAIPFIKICIYCKIKPNFLSILGLFIVAIGAWNIYIQNVTTGLVILFLGSAIDGLDGPLARYTNESSDYGDFLDSTVDRIAEMFIWGVFCLRFTDNEYEVLLVFAILTGSFLIPYTRAKAESMNLYINVGLTPRPERVIFAILYMAIEPNSGFLYMFTILVWITVIQRFNILHKRI